MPKSNAYVYNYAQKITLKSIIMPKSNPKVYNKAQN